MCTILLLLQYSVDLIQHFCIAMSLLKRPQNVGKLLRPQAATSLTWFQKPSPGLLWNSHAKPRNNTTFIWMEIRYERLKSDLKMWTKCKTFISFLYCIVCSLLFFNIKTHHQKKALRLMFRKHYSIRSCKRTTTHVLRIQTSTYLIIILTSSYSKQLQLTITPSHMFSC